ncbi:MAG: response regulator [Myxococcota bacterium]
MLNQLNITGKGYFITDNYSGIMNLLSLLTYTTSLIYLLFAIYVLYLNRKNILVIDDEPVIRELANDMLNHLGFNAFTASGSKEGLEIIKKNLDISSKIEAVILDLHLKDDLDAISILKMIKLIDKDIRVIICSGSSRDPFLTRYLEYGFYKALLKPFNLNDLNNALK